MSRRAWERRAIARGSEAQFLPRATMPREAETILPAGPDRLLAATQLARVELAPADARGYRVGIQQGQRLMRWFPPARFTIAVRPGDRRLLLTDGDRTYKPWTRWGPLRVREVQDQAGRCHGAVRRASQRGRPSLYW